MTSLSSSIYFIRSVIPGLYGSISGTIIFLVSKMFSMFCSLCFYLLIAIFILFILVYKRLSIPSVVFSSFPPSISIIFGITIILNCLLSLSSYFVVLTLVTSSYSDLLKEDLLSSKSLILVFSNLLHSVVSKLLFILLYSLSF